MERLMDKLQDRKLLHGGDYNVEQWLDRPEILDQDIHLMKKVGVNVVTLCVFAWASLEPQEGKYALGWLDKIMDSMYENGIYVILATPSGGKPPWMVKEYPDIMRVNARRERLLYGERENHCNSSEIFRKKVRQIDELLGERYGGHPALLLWHISNEMYGQCHCERCQTHFRDWLKKKYGTVDNLNREYWSHFWSHTYTDWTELESPSPIGETAVHGLALDYRRFYSDLSIDFLKMEIKAVRKYHPDVPVTTNLFCYDCGIDYGKLAKSLDLIAWDSYPQWHKGKDKDSEWDTAVSAAFGYDMCRALKQKPFLLMESSPSSTNWADIAKLKRPGMHWLGSFEAVACGADSVQYFQWRQSRGAFEKFHGAVLTHNGSENTRVFRDVAYTGQKLKEIAKVQGTQTNSKVAVIFDWNNMCGLREQKSLRNVKPEYEEIILEHYEALVKNYVSVDVIMQDADFSSYQLIVAPMLYMFLPQTAGKIREFVGNGGTFVMTFYSGLVNENDLAYECFPPYFLNDVFGVKSEEVDCLCEDEYNTFLYEGKTYRARYYCDLLHENVAEVLAAYQQDFYKGLPVLTRNPYEKGTAYYLSARTDAEFLYDFYRKLLDKVGADRIISSSYVPDVMVKERSTTDKKYIFLMNFSSKERLIEGEILSGYEGKIVER